jgi:molecular chaperone DnaK
MIERNTTIPTRRSQPFSTAADGQTQVEIHVLQGERPLAADNKSLGRFILDGIPPAPRGVPQIEVTFDIDANGIVHVSARDLGTGKEQKIRIESSSGLSEDEIRRMVKEAESHAREDRRERERAEARNEADTLLYSTEKSLRDLGEKVTAEDRTAVETAAAELRAALTADDLGLIRSRTEALTRAAYRLAEEVYKERESAHKRGAETRNGSGDRGKKPGGDERGRKPGDDPSRGPRDGAEDVDYEVVE